jgi:uncharacterized protein involved in exopolysaccharide biosynthesis
MESRETIIDLLKFYWSKRKVILRNVLILAGLTAIVSLIMPNYYKATTLFYAGSTDVMKPEHIFGYSNQPMQYYGSGVDLDRILIVAQSNELVDFMIDSFHLMRHYHIDSTSRFARLKAQKNFNQLYKVDKTKLDAIELSVEDKDTKVSAAMANAAREKINQISTTLLKKSLASMLATIKSTMDSTQKSLVTYNGIIDSMRLKYKIIDPASQAELMTERVLGTETKLNRERQRLKALEASPGIPRDTISMLRALVSGMEKEYQALTDTGSTSIMNMDNFNAGRDKLEVLMAQQKQAKEFLVSYESKYNQVKSILDGNARMLYLIQSAETPEKKSRPVRSLLVVIAAGAGFFGTLLGLLLLRVMQDPQWKRIWNA